MDKPEILISDTRKHLDLEAKYKLLETFEIENQYTQLIKIQTKEFSAVCPGTGLPDIAEITIEYIPQKKCVELKALKYYFFSFRNDAIFQEPVTDVIFGHLLKCLEPKYLRLEVIYNIRGGFLTTTFAEYGDKNKCYPNQTILV
jgi:7-cyano-7-deazaguanine reductase